MIAVTPHAATGTNPMRSVNNGPAVSACGKPMPCACRKPFAYPDQPTDTAPAATAYSRISAQPTIQATSSPNTA